jgi:hypothetical protein
MAMAHASARVKGAETDKRDGNRRAGCVISSDGTQASKASYGAGRHCVHRNEGLRRNNEAFHESGQVPKSGRPAGSIRRFLAENKAAFQGTPLAVTGRGADQQ